MSPRRLLTLFAVLALFVSGCGHLDTSPPASEDRVLNGMVNYDLQSVLPPDAVITVRVIDESDPGAPMKVLGEARIEHPGPAPIPFKLEYRATDQQLMHQVNVEARVSFGGKLRFRSIGGHPITLGNVNDLHVVKVELL